jgi:hypothetical protein
MKKVFMGSVKTWPTQPLKTLWIPDQPEPKASSGYLFLTEDNRLNISQSTLIENFRPQV